MSKSQEVQRVAVAYRRTTPPGTSLPPNARDIGFLTLIDGTFSS